jgi:hypothetical protein
VRVPFPASVRSSPETGRVAADFDGFGIHLNIKVLSILRGGGGDNRLTLRSIIAALRINQAASDTAFMPCSLAYSANRSCRVGEILKLSRALSTLLLGFVFIMLTHEQWHLPPAFKKKQKKLK